MMGRDPQILAACVLAAVHNPKELIVVDAYNIAVAALDIYDALEGEAKDRSNRE